MIVNELGHPLYGISIPGQTPMFMERAEFGRLRSEYITVQELDSIESDGQTVIAPLYDKGMEEEIRKRFPQADIVNKEYFKAYIIK